MYLGRGCIYFHIFIVSMCRAIMRLLNYYGEKNGNKFVRRGVKKNIRIEILH